MFSGIKFIPRDQIDERGKSTHTQGKNREKKCSSRSSSEEDLERIKGGSRKNKKWYDSDEDLSSKSEYSGSASESERDQKKFRSRKRVKKRHKNSSEGDHKGRSLKKSRIVRKEYSSEDEYLDKLSEKEKQKKWGNSRLREVENSGSDDNPMDHDLNDGSKRLHKDTVRKEMGLEWMVLQSKDSIEKTSDKASQIEAKEAPAKVIKKDNPRELNPYLKDNGSGYPEELEGIKTEGKQLLSSSVVGDGGASWRLKALKRSQEQAAREGRQLQEVVQDRWGSMGHFAASVASRNVAPTHAHLHAIKKRRKGLLKEEQENIAEDIDGSTQKDSDRRTGNDILPRHPKMRVPKVHDSLSWGRREYKNLSTEDTALVSAAMSELNKFSNDGSFMDKFMPQKDAGAGGHGNSSSQTFECRVEHKSVKFEDEITTEDVSVKPSISANQLAAKALQLRMKGKHEEAEQLLKEAEKIKVKPNTDNSSSKMSTDGTTSRCILHDVSSRQKKKEDDADLNLAKTIMHNHSYSISGQADDEYDFDAPRTKTRKKGGGDSHKSSEITNSVKRFMTQQDRCQFCFDNPTRPKHLTIAIANFTYLSLPQMQPIVSGHCYIMTLQHESSTRVVDDNVWDEIRNFKKCLIMMFSKQERDVVFLETVLGLAHQRRHCLVECIPLPREIAKQAPVYFKKAIDEAEDEWSQHNAKKLIDTSVKGLRNSIPKNFPYFHVEFGLNKGFVHVIDDEKGFKSSFGLDILRGMLQLPAEDMHRRWRHESLERQKQAVASFARNWEPFDWTKQLD